MKLPKDTAEGGFMIGDQKFVLFAALALAPVEEHDAQSGLIYRAGEISCISSKDPSEDDAPFDMRTAVLMPMQLSASSVEDAAEKLANEITTMAKRVIDWQGRTNEAPPASGQCCGGHCHADKEDVVEAAIDAGDPEALLAAVESEQPATNETP